MVLRITVNGASREVPLATTLADLIVLLEVHGRYAIEVNGDIAPRSSHTSHTLRDGDRVEVVAAIGGG